MISVFSEQPFEAGAEVVLDELAAAHVRARRIEPGEQARVLDGFGSVGSGVVAAFDKRHVRLRVDEVMHEARPAWLEVLVPVADKDRMLWAAEKCVELQVTVWRPTYYARSRSVNPRGEGPRFREKVMARMRSALEQSGGAWLPDIAPEMDFTHSIAAVDSRLTRLILDSSGTSILPHIASSGMALAIGPEGGLEPSERELAVGMGWRATTLGETTLRFETAIVAGVAVIRAAQTEGDR